MSSCLTLALKPKAPFTNGRSLTELAEGTIVQAVPYLPQTPEQPGEGAMQRDPLQTGEQQESCLPSSWQSSGDAGADGRNTRAFVHCSQKLANKRLEGRRLRLSSQLEGTGHGVREDTVGGGGQAAVTRHPQSLCGETDVESATPLAFSLRSTPPSPHP